MAGIDIKIEIGDELERALDLAIDRTADLSQPMRAIAAAMYDGVDERFDRERDPIGIPWKKSQRAIEDGGKTLQASGDLRRAIVADSGKDYAAVLVNTQGSISYADRSVMDYAAIHQFGGTIKPRNKKALSWGGRIVAQIVMPARAYLGFGDFEKEETADILSDFLTNAFRK